MRMTAAVLPAAVWTRYMWSIMSLVGVAWVCVEMWSWREHAALVDESRSLRALQHVSADLAEFATSRLRFVEIADVSWLNVAALSVVAVSSFVSGVFGSAGGTLLLATLLVIFNVPTAMVLHGTVMVTGNVWRSVIWRQWTAWGLIAKYMVGTLATFALMWPFAFMPDKAITYLLLGAATLLIRFVPDWMSPTINRPGAAYGCGAGIGLLQLFAGTGGGTLDACFQRTGFDRREVVATKATIQVCSNILRIAYFGSMVWSTTTIAAWMLPVASLVSMVAISLAAAVVCRMTNEGFRQWTGYVIIVIGCISIMRGLSLLVWA